MYCGRSNPPSLLRPLANSCRSASSFLLRLWIIDSSWIIRLNPQPATGMYSGQQLSSPEHHTRGLVFFAFVSLKMKRLNLCSPPSIARTRNTIQTDLWPCQGLRWRLLKLSSCTQVLEGFYCYFLKYKPFQMLCENHVIHLFALVGVKI